jgi:hypothetical protein
VGPIDEFLTKEGTITSRVPTPMTNSMEQNITMSVKLLPFMKARELMAIVVRINPIPKESLQPNRSTNIPTNGLATWGRVSRNHRIEVLVGPQLKRSRTKMARTYKDWQSVGVTMGPINASSRGESVPNPAP